MVPRPLIVPAVLEATKLFMLTALVTVKMTALFTESVPAALAKAREAQVLFPSTVNVKPLPTTISSVVAGMVPPGQGALGVVELQLPEPDVVTVAA